MYISKGQEVIIKAIPGKDNSRAVLKNVCIRGDKAIACNGFMLAQTDIQLAPDEMQDHDVLIPADAFDVSAIACMDLNTVHAVEGGYPSTDNLWERSLPNFRIAFDPRYLGAITDMAKKSGADTVKFWFWGERKGAEYEFETKDGKNIRGIIMPMFFNESTWQDTIIERELREFQYLPPVQLNSFAPVIDGIRYQDGDIHLNDKATYSEKYYSTSYSWLSFEEVKA